MPEQLDAGFELRHYRIIGKLGSGGMADVYEAEDSNLGRRVALKLLPPQFLRSPGLVERFQKEVRAAAALNHPNIVTVFEVGQQDDFHFYTMPLLRGGDLHDKIAAGMTVDEALLALRQLADAFSHAHANGFVHRDVKPENVLFDNQDVPILTDFGIAKAMDGGTRMTATGMSIGTPRYISPEQARGRNVDGRADLYSLGVMFFEMLTGKPPYQAEESVALILKHVTEPIPVLPEHCAYLQPVIEKLMAKEPDDRYATASELIQAIDALGLPSSGASPGMSIPGLFDSGTDSTVVMPVAGSFSAKKSATGSRSAERIVPDITPREQRVPTAPPSQPEVTKSAPKESSRNHVPVILIVVVIALIAAVAVFLLMSQRDDGERVDSTDSEVRVSEPDDTSVDEAETERLRRAAEEDRRLAEQKKHEAERAAAAAREAELRSQAEAEAAARLEAEREAQRKSAELEALKAEEEARRKAEEEKSRIEEQEAKRRAEEAQRLKEEAAKHEAEERQRKAEEEVRLKAEAEAKAEERRRAEAAAKKRAAAEAKRKQQQRSSSTSRSSQSDARKAADAEARRRAAEARKRREAEQGG